MVKVWKKHVWLLALAGCAADSGQPSGAVGRESEPLTNGVMVWPTSGQITRRSVPGGHAGLDIGAAEGTEVRAPFDGVVHLGVDETRNVVPDANLKCPNTGGRGRFLWMDHPGDWHTRFYHLSEQIAPDGASVKQGDLIARVGNTGCSTGAHLHMEVLQGANRLYDWDDNAPNNPRVGDPIPYDFPGLNAEDPVGWDGCTGGERDACAAMNQNCSAHACVRKPTDYGVHTGDFDGDGKTDLLTLSPNAAGSFRDHAMLELGRDGEFASQMWAAGTAIHMTNGGVDARYHTRTGDFDGDGKTDLATVSPNSGGGWAEWFALELSSGSGFRSEVWNAGTPVHMRNGGPDANYVVLSGDFDGDRRADIATLSPNGGGGWAEWLALELSSGSGFRSEVWNAGTPVHMRNGGQQSWYFVLTGDFNGDGKTDIATVSPDAGGGWGEWFALELSTGSGFRSEVWNAGTPIHMRNGGTVAYRVLAGDFNGDGLTDVATLSATAGGGWAEWAALELSTGTGFRSEVWPVGTAIHMRNGGANDYNIQAADLNGDGKSDLVTFSQAGGGGWAEWYAVELSNGHGFDSQVWPSPTPQHARNGGAGDYRVLIGDFDANHKSDVAVVSPNGGGAWSGWITVDLSRGDGFDFQARNAGTPVHMRNGLR